MIERDDTSDRREKIDASMAVFLGTILPEEQRTSDRRDKEVTIVKQVIVMRKDLNMRRGKQIAQGAHASLKAYKQADKMDSEFIAWDTGKFTKICLYVESEQELELIRDNAIGHGLNVAYIIDSGLTEFNNVPTATCLCIGPHEASKIDAITGSLKLL